MKTSEIECFTVSGFTRPCLDCTNGTNMYAYKSGIAQSDKDDGYGQGKASDFFWGDKGKEYTKTGLAYTNVCEGFGSGNKTWLVKL